jgi:hypothetical protein
MSSLAELLLALALRSAPPGRSPYSFEVLPECGNDPEVATCELRPVCEHAGPLCAPPRFSKQRGGWARVESVEAAVRRYAHVAVALARAAEQLGDCKTLDRVACPEHRWPGSTRELALSGLAVALHESGLREDVQYGRGPLGRGPDGEVCLVQVSVDEVPKYATWIDDAERERLTADRQAREDLARTLLGGARAPLERCFDVGLRMLIRARAACSAAPVAWDHGMFAMYGSGHTCRLPSIADRRQRTLRALLAARPKLGPEHEPALDAALGSEQSAGGAPPEAGAPSARR